MNVGRPAAVARPEGAAEAELVLYLRRWPLYIFFCGSTTHRLEVTPDEDEDGEREEEEHWQQAHGRQRHPQLRF